MSASALSKASPDAAVLPTDDWPFLYLPEKSVPRAYLIVLLVLALASVITVKLAGLDAGRFSAYHAHMFFLGAAFLLHPAIVLGRGTGAALVYGLLVHPPAPALTIAIQEVEKADQQQQREHLRANRREPAPAHQDRGRGQHAQNRQAGTAAAGGQLWATRIVVGSWLTASAFLCISRPI